MLMSVLDDIGSKRAETHVRNKYEVFPVKLSLVVVFVVVLCPHKICF